MWCLGAPRSFNLEALPTPLGLIITCLIKVALPSSGSSECLKVPWPRSGSTTSAHIPLAKTYPHVHT